MKTILSIDPGGRGNGQTGIVMLSYDDKTVPKTEDSWAVGGALDGWLDWYNSEGKRIKPDTVVVEHYVNWGVEGADLTPVLIEGSVLTLMRDLDVYTQGAAGKNSLVPDRVLKELDMWFPGDHHHDRREAARHALVWLRNQLHLPTIRIINPGAFSK